jgi:hypothetical protein
VTTPLMSPEQASKLLDEIIHSRVRECIDFERLLTVELDLWIALCERDFSNDMRARQDAKAMIDRALGRLASDEDRYGELSPWSRPLEKCSEAQQSA